MTASSALRNHGEPGKPLLILHDVFGYSAFRQGQEEIIQTVLNGENVLAVMPTGSGKSLCFQLPTLVREGLTLVVSPLIALMRDQVAQLRNNGIEAGSLNSANSAEENRRVVDAVREGRMRLLYASPERLVQGAAAEWLNRAGVSLLAIDEAHCVSQWGHDFRPEYALLGEVRRRLGNVQTIALTATADVATRQDILSKLFDEATPRVFVQGFDRPNLYLAMQPKEALRRQIRQFLTKHVGESGIVYCSTRDTTDEMAERLRGDGVHALAYHAGLDAGTRARHQDTFLKEDGVVMAATVAFGMGIDKPDVRFVCHAALPKSIEAYYQEIGRAGRDGAPADTLTLYGLDDMRLRRMQIEQSDASPEQKIIERQRFNALIALCEAPRCRRQTLLAYFGERSEPCGHCDLCQDGVTLYDATVDAQKLLSAIVRTGERFGVEHLIAVLTGDETEAILKFGHQHLKTFGVGKDRGRQVWRSLIRQTYAAGLINLELAEYGRWSVTERGWAVLKGRETVELRADALRPKEKARTGGKLKPERGHNSDDEALLTALKALRMQFAREADVPAYVVFPDRSLIDMVAQRPQTLDDMANVHGVGQAKLARYGEAFLDVILRH